MARLMNGFPISGASAAQPSSPAAGGGDALRDLTRLLNRLQQTVLHADAGRERRLRGSEYERRKVETNIKFARSLLTRAEKEAMGMRVMGSRQAAQGVLVRERERLEAVVERMADLEEMVARRVGEKGEEEETDGEEDVLGEIMKAMGGTTTEEEEEGQEAAEEDKVAEERGKQEERPGDQEAGREEGRDDGARAGTQTQQNMRSRGGQGHPTTLPPAPSENEKAPDRSTTKGYTSGTDLITQHTSTATTEALLDQQRAEQDLLTESLVGMASRLKASAQAFAAGLESEKDVLDRAGSGLEKTGSGLAVAGKRMGALRRVTEGKGWWGRVMLYAWIYGLMVALVLVVFVLPKVRFSTW